MRRLRRKAGNSDKVFGCDLLEHLAASCQEVPQVLRSCSEFIEEHGVVDGIYRLSGVSSNTQKLRSEFDSEGTPDLNKDIYLQDIHCVSSLCKAYFRELPNPLLTYQLYDKYAEAVAIQLEEERLVKIKEVLKELPAPHYRTLEFLMRHLVRMASHSSHTNMHARNLAIVWAPNLLRSKDIEASGFNGTAAFMEVRVQSIVVEFILTHVPQLFPDSSVGSERRKSLPSPSIQNPEEPFFRSLPFQLGNISPGDGPPAMRSYHAIIDGTDKRKGSLKGRKWKSIFNLGGRLHDPRRRNKNSKDKEKTVLRPAKSMDSLSSGPYLHEGTKQHLSTAMSPLAPTSPCLTGGADTGASSSSVGSGYAVTYRRGQGASVSVVSGGGGTQGTYSRLDCCGGNSTDALQPPSRSPGLSSKADRRAGIHISGPFSVTVPLHVTSGLAFRVLQGGGADIGTYRGGQEGGDKEDGMEGEKNKERDGERQSQVKVLGEGVTERGNKQDEALTVERQDDERMEKKEDEQEEKGVEVNGGSTSKSAEEREGDVDAEIGDVEEEQDDEEGEYMDMKGSVQTLLEPPDVSYYPMDYDGSEQDCPLDFQDTFGFLDLMDSSGSQMFQEFSVEPHHGEDEDEYEDEVEQRSPGLSPYQPDPVPEPPRNTHTHLQTHTLTHRPLRLDQFGQINKSMSLPYMSRPFLPALSSSSEDDADDDVDGDDDDYDKDDDDDEEDNDMFCKSLPSSLVFNRMTWNGPNTDLENILSATPGPSQLLDSGSDDRPILIGQSQSSEVEKDIESPECCDPSEEVLSHSNADGENMMEAMESEEDRCQETGSQEKPQEGTLTNTSSESNEVEESCHNVKNRIMEQEVAPAEIERDVASASTSPGCESSLQTTADGQGEDTRLPLQVRDEDEVLKSSCGGVILKSSNEETVIEDKAAEAGEYLLTVSHTVSCAEEPEDIMKEKPEDISGGSAGGVLEQPKSSVKREMVGDGEEKTEEEDMKQNEDRNEQNEIVVEEVGAVNEGDMTEEREVLVMGEKDVMVEEKDVMVEEKDVMVEEKDVMVGEKDVMVEEKDVMVGEKDVMVAEKDVMVEEKDVMVEEKDVIVEEKDVMVGEKDVMVEEKDVMVEEKDVMVEEKDVMVGEKDVMVEEKDPDTVSEEEENIAGDEGEGGQQEEEMFEEMNSIVVREDSGESTEGQAETKESMGVEVVIETKDRTEIQQDEIINDMITKEETNRHEEGMDTTGETAGRRVEKMLTDDEEQDLEALHVVQERERDKHLIKDVVAEANRDEDKEIDCIIVDQQEAEEGDRTGRDEDEENEEAEKEGEIKEQTPTIREEELEVVKINSTEPNGTETEGSKAIFEKGPGRVLVTSKQQAKVYQVRSVPVVPPKPHHCRLTALNLRQQQGTGKREVDRDRESGNVYRALEQHDTDQERKMGGKPEPEHRWNEERDGEGRGRRDWQAQWTGERRRDVDDMTRNSPKSMCFDKAVAMGIKRGREKESSERDKQKERGYDLQ